MRNLGSLLVLSLVLGSCQSLEGAVDEGLGLIGRGGGSSEQVGSISELEEQAKAAREFPERPDAIFPAEASTSVSLSADVVDAGMSESFTTLLLGESIHAQLNSVCTDTHRLRVHSGAKVAEQWGGQSKDADRYLVEVPVDESKVVVQARLRELTQRDGKGQTIRIGGDVEHESGTDTVELGCTIDLEVLDPESGLVLASREGTAKVVLSARDALLAYRGVGIEEASGETRDPSIGHLNSLIGLALAGAMGEVLPELDQILLQRSPVE